MQCPNVKAGRILKETPCALDLSEWCKVINHLVFVLSGYIINLAVIFGRNQGDAVWLLFHIFGEEEEKRLVL